MINYVKTTRVNLQDRTLPKKTYAVAQARATMEIDGLAEHMSNHGSPFSKGTISAVITDMVSCMRECLLDGYKIHLGDLGNFYAKLKTKGVCESVIDEDTGEKPVFTASDITAVRTTWTPGSDFTDMINDASFHEVDSISVQQASLVAKQSKLVAGTYGSTSSSTGE